MATQKKTKTPASNSGISHRDRIVDAAISCFLRFGVAKTFAVDIAREAGLARATVYRVIPNRQELFEAVSYKRLGELARKVKLAVDACESFDDAVVKGALVAVKGFREDKVAMMMVESTGDLGVERFLLDPESPAVLHMVEAYRDAFEAARQAGELRSDLTDIEIAAWLKSVIFPMALNNKLRAKDQEYYLRKFVIPSITNPVKVPLRKASVKAK